MKRIKIVFNQIKNNIIKNIKKMKKEHIIKSYIKNNKLFLAFVIICVINSTVLRFFCMHSIENYLSWRAVLADLVIITLAGSFGYLLKPKNRFIYYFCFCIFFSGICMINSVYYTFYTSFASISMH